jgi:glycosyltransferase involved in cell wall biosynthesis
VGCRCAGDGRGLSRGRRVIDVLVDADVLGRRRTGDETYVENLLRELPTAAPDLRFTAVTRNPERVPSGVEPLELRTGSQKLRMAWQLPRLLRRVRPRVGHYQHALPLRPVGATVLTVHDLSFEREPELMPRGDRRIFKAVVPRSARKADRVIAVSDRTKEDLIELYDLPAAKIAVIPHGVDRAFRPGEDDGHGYLLFVGAVQRRKDPRAALEAAQELRMPLVVVGPEKEDALARELRRLGADLRGYVEKAELAALYRGAACLVVPSRYEGFGLPVLEAMASGTPVVAAPDPALVEVAGDAAVFADQGDLSGAILHALDRRSELRAAGLLRASQFSWAEAARRTVDVYRKLL